jgi:L-asparaginase II
MIRHPELMSGTGRACAVMIRGCNGRAAVKAGAEGFFAAWIPEKALGVALKIDDGAARASETAIAAVLDRLDLLGPDPKAQALLRAPVLNTRGATVGERRPASALATIRLT